MKNKGFTLIELLAVIVILAIVTLITIPLIGNVIEKSRQESFKDSVLAAFDAVEYYVVNKNLGDIPESGIDVKELKLKNNEFISGRMSKNANGKLVAEFLSNGKYCATGLMTNLKINKGDCEITSPIIEANVNEKEISIKVTDDYGIIGYMITESKEEPTKWNEVKELTSIVETITADHAGTYYIHTKNKYGKTMTKEYTIAKNAFTVDIIVVNDSKETSYEFPKGDMIDLSLLEHAEFTYYTFEGFVFEGTTEILTELEATEGIRLNCSYKRDNGVANYTHEKSTSSSSTCNSSTLTISNFIAEEFVSGSLYAGQTGSISWSGGALNAGQTANVGVVNNLSVKCCAGGTYLQSSATLTLVGKSGIIK